jgi:endo-1,4-beta-mannosidase
MWRDYDADVVGQELDQLREHEMVVTRSFFYWPDFMPTPDALDENLVGHYADFLDQHAARGMRTIPTFIVGHMSGQNWDPAWRNGRDIFSDVWFVARQAWYVRELTRRFAHHEAIAGWLLSNEIPIYGHWQSGGVGTLDAEAVRSWAQILIDAIRAGGGTQPVSTGDGNWGVEVTGADNGFRIRELAPMYDFHGPHVYRMENDPVRQNLGSAFICELLDIAGKPVVMEEFGLTSDYVGEQNAAHYYRQVLHNTLLAGATGWLGWNNVDYDDLYDVEPYLHHPFEMHFGLIDQHGRPKAQAVEMQKFGQLLRRVDIGRLSRPDTSAALVVSSFLESQYPFTYPDDPGAIFANTRQAYVAAREADLPVGVVRERDGLPDDVALYLLPSVKQLTSPTWRSLGARVEAGATVYASVFLGVHATQRGPWWAYMDETFGVQHTSRYGLNDPVADDTVSLRFAQDFGGITAGEELVFPVGGTANSRSYFPVEPAGAEVIAVDGHGRPALLRHRIGSGAAILATYPLEHFAASTPFVNPEPTYRLYEALAQDAGIERPVTVPDPRVMAAELHHEDGRRFVWLVSQAAEELTVTPSASGRLVDLDGAQVEAVALDPYGVVVLQHQV